MSSCLRRRLSRRKFHHEPADIDGLSTLLSKVSVVTNSDKKGPSGNTHKPRRIRSENDVTRSCYKCKNKKLKRLSSSSPSPASLAKAHGRIDLDNDLEKISLKLGAISFEMDGMGNWTNSLKDSDMKELIETNARSNSRLSQENNLLRVKNELLADMIAKKTLRIGYVGKELDKLRKLLSTSSSRFSMSSRSENTQVKTD